jgi:hypothetical protein
MFVVEKMGDCISCYNILVFIIWAKYWDLLYLDS